MQTDKQTGRQTDRHISKQTDSKIVAAIVVNIRPLVLELMLVNTNCLW